MGGGGERARALVKDAFPAFAQLPNFNYPIGGMRVSATVFGVGPSARQAIRCAGMMRSVPTESLHSHQPGAVIAGNLARTQTKSTPSRTKYATFGSISALSIDVLSLVQRGPYEGYQAQRQ